MILVCGGTGALGRVLVERLISRGEKVRILTRDTSRAASVSEQGVEVVEGDVRDPSSLAPALAGVDVVVSAVQGFVGPDGVSPDSVDKQGNFNLIEAASQVGAAFVLVSVVGAAPESPMELFRAKYAAEERLRSSGLAWTIVRATSFMETWATIMGEPLLKNGKLMVFGRGDNPINFVSAVDVAAMVELAVREPALQGRVLEIGGSENISFNKLAEELQTGLDRRGKVVHIPRPMLRIMAAVTGRLNPTLARQTRAAIEMDTRNMTFDSSSLRAEFPTLPNTDLATALARRFQRADVARV